MASGDSVFSERIANFLVVAEQSPGKTSHVWKYFGTLLYESDGKRRTVDSKYFCKLCVEDATNADPETPFLKCKLCRYARSVSTSNLSTHLREEHKVNAVAPKGFHGLKEFFRVEARQPAASGCNSKSLLARDLVLWAARDLLPFSFVDGEGLQDFFLKYGVTRSSGDLPNRTTLSRGALSDVYMGLSSSVKEMLQRSARYCAITFDLWTDAYKRRNYITFTCHFVDENFHLQPITLSTRNMVQRHTGAAIWEEFTKCLEEFDIKAKVVTAVTDAGSNVKRAVSLADIDHHLCLGHGLHNLVVRDGFGSIQELNALLVKCRAIVKCLHYKATQVEELMEQEHRKALLEFVTLGENLDKDESDPVSISGNEDHTYSAHMPAPVVSIKRDTPTRWHSILMMLESLLSNRRCIKKLLLAVGEGTVVTLDEWCLMEELTAFLGKLRVAVELLSRDRSCTFNLILVLRSELKACLQSTQDDSVLVKELKLKMREKFEHRFPVTEAVVTASLLDPRFHNLNALDEYLAQKGESKVEFLLRQTLKHVRDGDLSGIVQGHCVAQNDPLSLLAARHSSKTVVHSDAIRAECHALLGMPMTSVCLSGNVLEFWGSMSVQFPWLSCLARKVLCVPATSTPSERVFSVAGLVVRAKRARLHPSTVDKVIFIHDNYSFVKGSD